MAQQLTMRVGEQRQLRAHDAVRQWTSDAPEIAAVADEDVVTGRRGGLVSALVPGRARICAVGLGSELLVEVELTVEGAQALTVAAGEVVPIPAMAGVERWTSSLPHVAEVTSAGQVRGMSPGVVLLRSQSQSGSIDLLVRVSGVLEMEVNQSRNLASQFAVPVRSWRCEASAATIDNHGTVTAGDRPRLVPIRIVLEDGSDFTFDLRIMRSTVATLSHTPQISTPMQGATRSSRQREAESPLSASSSPTPPQADQALTSQRQEVRLHLDRARSMMEQQLWSGAGAELTAANIAASGDAELEDLVRRERLRLAQSQLNEFAGILGQAAAALTRKDYAGAMQQLRSVRAPEQEMLVVAQLCDLANLLEKARDSEAASDEQVAQVHRALISAWGAARRIHLLEVMKAMSVLAVHWNAEEMIEALIDFLASPEGADAPSASSLVFEESLKEFSDLAFMAILGRLVAHRYDEATGPWLLGVLISFAPACRANVLVTFFAAQRPANQERLTTWFCQLLSPAAGVLFDLLAGVLKRMPPSPQIPKAVQARIGAKQLEDHAVKWASRNHKSAQIVLENLYGYPPAAVGRH